MSDQQQGSIGSMQNVAGLGLQGVNLGTLVVVALLAKGAFADAVGATEQASKTVEDLTDTVLELRNDVAKTRQAMEEAKHEAAATRRTDSQRIEALEKDIAAIRECLRNRRRCRDL